MPATTRGREAPKVTTLDFNMAMGGTNFTPSMHFEAEVSERNLFTSKPQE
jgi:hypothetical protein